MKILTSLNLTDGNYLGAEAKPNKQSQDRTKYYEQTNHVKNSVTVRAKLEEIEILIRSNRSAVQDKINNLNTSESIIRKQISDLNDVDTIRALSEQNISPDVMDIATVEFSQYYSKVNELKYKLKIISYQRNMFKERLLQLNNDINIIESYLDSL
jgi:hypothetical protein